jgi:predicted Zn-dependent protease
MHTCPLGQYRRFRRHAKFAAGPHFSILGRVFMNRIYRRSLALIFPVLFAAQTLRAQEHTARVEEAKSRAASPAHIAPAPLLLFGTIPVSTRSIEARKFAELSMEKYENVLLHDAVVQAQHATEKDPDFALGYALLSLASRHGIPNSAALERAKVLLPHAPADEQLLVRWMIGVQDRNLLPAIASMNDLLKRYPKNKHVLYLISEWLYGQQDFDRAQKMMESLLQSDPGFAPVLNMLGYSYIETAHPDPARAVATLKRYIAAEPSSPNPEDSLGEVLRYTGDNQGSLEHFSAALQIDPTFFTSQLGLGDTLTLMGKYDEARLEYDRAALLSENSRELLHASFQKALVYFWEGHAEEGRSALSNLAAEAAQKNEPNGQFEIAFGSAMLAADFATELHQLRALEEKFLNTVEGMTEADRGSALANVLCEEARVASQHAVAEAAQQAISKLERLAAQSADLVVENAYETARGYVLVAQGDLANAVDELSANRLSPLAVQQLAIAQQKLGNPSGVAESTNQLKYQRAPTVEWYLASQTGSITR